MFGRIVIFLNLAFRKLLIVQNTINDKINYS